MTNNSLRGERFQIDITGIAHGGEGIGRIDGQVIFVAGGIPGERVEVEVTEHRKRLLRGRPVRILEASPDRIEPPCPIVERCGGCQWQHIAYPRQLELKRQILIDQLRRIGGFADPPVEPTVASRLAFGYRATVRVARTGEGRLGFRAAHSHDVVPTGWCPVAMPAINAVLADPPPEAGQATELRIWGDPVTGQVAVAPSGASSGPRPPGAAAHVSISVLDRTFRVSAGSFMQANLPQLEEIARTVIEFLQPTGQQTVVDAYCGVGLIGICLAPLVNRVIGIEAGEAAVEDAAANGEQVPNFEIWSGTVAAVLPDLVAPIDAIVLDPPRAGCEPETLRAILDAEPATIVYVSCDPATLARDLKVLAAAGYQLVTTRPIDVFPQTFHVESVSLLRRRRTED